jgi:3-oxoacyl-[acyl-carrier protein] reductase
MKSERQLVIVTGTTSGLGQEIARVLLYDGYDVVGLGRRAQGDEQLNESEYYHHLEFDLEDLERIPALAQQISKEFGSAYGLVNNAAFGGDGLLLTQHSTEISRILRINLEAPITLSKFVARGMIARRSGRIVNISSIVAATGYRGLSVYAATKAGIEGFSRSLARDLGPRGVTVNCVAPGFMSTEMTSSLTEDNLVRIQRRAALGRFATAPEVAHAISYLMTPMAAGITGTVLTVDAGSRA